MKPVLRWVGGKTKLLSQLLAFVPEFDGTLFEPFVGGGAFFLSHMAKARLDCQIRASDTNRELVLFYEQVRDNVQQVLNVLSSFQNTKECYAQVRSWDRATDFSLRASCERAARFYFLNKTSFQGLWRVNLHGYHNVPYVRQQRDITGQELIEFSRSLQRVTFNTCDFGDAVTTARPGDFVYFDPPYISNFVDYTMDRFKMQEQQRLRDVCVQLTSRGVKFMQSNSDTEITRELYKDFHIGVVTTKRLIAAKASSRKTVSELVIMNY